MSLSIKNLIFNYSNKKVLENFSCQVREKEFVSIIGLSGCGKSTLLNIIAGFLKPQKGAIYFDKELVKGTSPERVMVFQEDAVFPWYTVSENISYSSVIKDKKTDLTSFYIKEVGLSGFENYYPKELSGGMKKRVDLARAYNANPKVLLLDEPFGALDAYTRQKMQMLLLSLWGEDKKVVMFVTHDISEALFLSDRIILMSNSGGAIDKEYKVNFSRPRKLGLKKTKPFLEQLETIEQDLSKMEVNEY